MPAPDFVWWAGLAKKLNLLSVATSFVPLAVGAYRWSQLRPGTYPLVWVALVPGCLLGVLSEIGRHVFHNNIVYQHLIPLAETLLLGWAYWYALTGPRNRRFLVASLTVFVLVFVGESVYWGGFWQGENPCSHAVQTIVLLSFALLYFEQLLRELRTIQLEHDPMFLVSVGVMLYYAGTIVVFLLEVGMQQQQQIDQIWTMFIIQAVLLMVFNAFLTLALWNTRR
ncbi:hypothetical protein [Hymenobacter persicinus]|uniref:Uncharacterized protein n=1 Tax=Hymenobacter persicinus TaxID=2025506 RepID=A0A4Q5LFQ7_9BACT|nr:hypothetical protein [Hymenobacter persicinus]RYU82181.1 hypothetical protein EWM57_05210 [Hymenobacter persicinus]